MSRIGWRPLNGKVYPGAMYRMRDSKKHPWEYRVYYGYDQQQQCSMWSKFAGGGPVFWTYEHAKFIEESFVDEGVSS